MVNLNHLVPYGYQFFAFNSDPDSNRQQAGLSKLMRHYYQYKEKQAVVDPKLYGYDITSGLYPIGKRELIKTFLD